MDNSIRLGHGITVKKSYQFIVSGRGQAKVELYRNCESQSGVIPWKDSPSGITDRALTNRLKIAVRGEMLRHCIYDTYIGEIKS